MHQTTRTSHLVLIPLILTYFAMGFVDLVGIASNYLKVAFLSEEPLHGQWKEILYIPSIKSD